MATETVKEKLEDAEKSLRKWKSDAKEAGEELGKASKGLKRLSHMVGDRESPERAVSAVIPAAALALLSNLGTNYLTDKLGGAVGFVGRNADIIKGAVPTLTGLGSWAGELATRDGRPLGYGRDFINRTSEYSIVLGIRQLGAAFWARHKANQRLLQQAQGAGG